MDVKMFKYLLDSFREPVMFMDAGHTIRYLNKAAAGRYTVKTDFTGRSIFKCHNEHSNEIIRNAFKGLEDGQEEAWLMEDRQYQMFMRAVRDESGSLLGYYVRFEAKPDGLPPIDEKERFPG